MATSEWAKSFAMKALTLTAIYDKPDDALNTAAMFFDEARALGKAESDAEKYADGFRVGMESANQSIYDYCQKNMDGGRFQVTFLEGVFYAGKIVLAEIEKLPTKSQTP